MTMLSTWPDLKKKNILLKRNTNCKKDISSLDTVNAYILFCCELIFKVTQC